MSNEDDELDRRVLQLICSDLELLEISINDLVIALGGKLKSVDKSYFNSLKSGKLSDCFSRNVRNERNYRFYQLFKGLDLQVDSFIRITRLHFDRGVAFLSKYGSAASSIKLFCLCYVDVVVDLYDGVLKQVLTFSLHDCVYLYKFFVKFDNSLLSYGIKHVYIRDEIYDLILNSLWFALKDAWWLYLDTSLLRSLFPFISHMKVQGNYQATIHDLNHVLHNIHFVTLISQDISFQSETQTIVDSSLNNEELESLNGQFESEKVKYENIQESDLNIKYARRVETLGLNEDEDRNGNTEFEDKISIGSENRNVITENRDYREVHEFGKKLREFENTLESYELMGEVNWSQVVYISLVGFVYIVLFESYLNVVYENLKVDMESKNYVEFLVKRLQDLIQVHGLMVEVDVNYTAWAHDKLGAFSDRELIECFNTYSDTLFFEDGYRENQLFSYRGDGISSDMRWRLASGNGSLTMYLLAPALERLQKMQYRVVLQIASECASPVLKLIEEIYTVSESKLYYDILHNTDEYLIGPKGPLSSSCRMLPMTFKRAVFVETFFIIVKKYVNKVRESGTDVCEAIFFDTMSMWDSIIDFFDFSVNPEVMEEECVKLVASILEQIKFTPNLDMSGLDSYKRSFRVNFFSTPKNLESVLSLYAYNCLYHVGFIIASPSSASNTSYTSTGIHTDHSNATASYNANLINTGNLALNSATGNPGFDSEGANYGSQTNTTNQASRSATTGHPNDATKTSTTFGAPAFNDYQGLNGNAAVAYTSQANCYSKMNTCGPTASPSRNPNLTSVDRRSPLFGVTPAAPSSYERDCETRGRADYLDKYMVWLDGSRRKNMLVFGNLILFFRGNSLLQPVGFITLNSIYSILSPNSLAQVHPSIQILENNSENDSFSCGTSKSSESRSDHSSDEHPNQLNRCSTTLRTNKNTTAVDTEVSSPLFGEVNVPSREDVTTVKQRNYMPCKNNDAHATKTSIGTENTNSPFRINISESVLHLRNVSKNRMASLTYIKPYLAPGSDMSRRLRGGNAASITRYSTNSSRFSTMFENMLVWGWQIRLELFDSCVLDDMNLFNVDIEFTSPEFRKYWEQQIRDKAKAKAQFMSWPYHSFFFDSI